MDIQELVRAQRTYFDTGVTRPYAFRLLQLKKLQQALRDNEQLLERAMMQDFRKAPMEVYMCETGMVLEELRFHLKHLKGWMRERAVPTPLAQFPAKSFVSPEPYGVALIISPWNYPVQLCLSPLVGAISGGNCAVVKPSAYAPATSAAIAKLIRETFDARYIAAVEGGRAENSALLAQRFDTIFFTGSVAVGKVVMEAAAKHLTPVTLELGGKSPVIVDKTADLKLAARRIAFGKVLNAGQTCVEPDYLLIDTSVKDAFVREYRAALQAFFPDGRMDEMPVIVSEKHFARVTKLLEGQNACIGGTFDEKTRFVAPTLLDGVSPDSPVMQEEIFGPAAGGHRLHPRPGKAAGAVSVHLRPGCGAAGAGQLLVWRRLHQRHDHPSGHDAHALRRRRPQRHGQLSRQKELRDLHPRALDRQKSDLARPAAALPPILGKEAADGKKVHEMSVSQTGSRLRGSRFALSAQKIRRSGNIFSPNHPLTFSDRADIMAPEIRKGADTR